jgi:hypothetical protein
MCFLFSLSTFTFGVFPKFPLVVVSTFLEIHFESNLEILITTLNKNYKHINI